MAWPSGFSTSGAGFSDQRWLTFVEVEALGEDRHVCSDDIPVNRRREFGVASPLRRTLELIGAVEQRAQLCRPWLLFDLCDGLQFAQVMRPAEGVCIHPTHMGVIGFPVIMNDRSAAQEGWNSPALGADAIMGEGSITDRVQPVQLTGDTQSGLVQMPNAAFREPGNNVLDHAIQATRCAIDPVGHAGRAQTGRTEEVAQELADPIFRDQLLNIAVDRRRPNALAVLHVRGHAIGKGGRRRGSAMGTTINRCLMLGDLQARRGHVEHLTFLRPLDHLCRQAMLTGATILSFMSLHKVWRWRLAQGVASVAGLAATFLAGLATQAARRRLLRPITRRRFAAIAAVPGHLPAQIRILFRHDRQLLRHAR